MTDITIFPEWARVWAEKRLSGQEVSTTDVIHVKDWLNAYSEENPKIKTKIIKLRWEDAMIAQKKWHKALLEKTEKLKKFSGNPNDIEKIMDGHNGNTWNYITSKEGLQFEGEVMGHCVGNYNYQDKNIITLRDKNNISHITIEIEGQDIIQIQGKGNSAIHSRYSDDVSKLINELNLSVSNISIENIIIVKNFSKKNYEFNHKDKLIQYIERNINDDMEFISNVDLNYRDNVCLEIPYTIYTDYDEETTYQTLDNLSDNVVTKIMSMLVNNIYINSYNLFDKIKDAHDVRVKKIHFTQGIDEEHVDFINGIKQAKNNTAINIVNHVSNSSYSLPSINNKHINLNIKANNNLKKIELCDSTFNSIHLEKYDGKNVKVNMKNSNVSYMDLSSLSDIDLVIENAIFKDLKIRSFNSFQYKDVFLENFIYNNNNSNTEYVLFYNDSNGEFKSVSYEDYCKKISNIRKSKGNLNDLELFPENSKLLWCDNAFKIFKIPDFTDIHSFVDTKNIIIIGNNVNFESELRLNRKVISVGDNVKAKSFLISDKRFLDLNLEGENLSIIDMPEVNINENLKFKNIKVINCDDIDINNHICKHFKIIYAKNIDMQNTSPDYISVKTKESVQDMVDAFIPPTDTDNVTIDFVNQMNKHYPYSELQYKVLKM